MVIINYHYWASIMYPVLISFLILKTNQWARYHFHFIDVETQTTRLICNGSPHSSYYIIITFLKDIQSWNWTQICLFIQNPALPDLCIPSVKIFECLLYTSVYARGLQGDSSLVTSQLESLLLFHPWCSKKVTWIQNFSANHCSCIACHSISTHQHSDMGSYTILYPSKWMLWKHSPFYLRVATTLSGTHFSSHILHRGTKRERILTKDYSLN